VAKDRRKNLKLTQDDVYKLLDSNQLKALRESAIFGWKIKFIRRPLFLEPVIILYNARYDIIGILDLDGNIDMETELDVRSSKQPKEQQSPIAATREKRKGMGSIPDNLDELLSPMQLSALRKIEGLGWKLHFIRRPVSTEPVAVVISPKGDKYVALKQDGLLRLMPDSAVRKHAPTEETDSVQLVPAVKTFK